MIEQFLQTGLEFFKEIWFQLNSRFDLENTEAFAFLKPYLIQLQDNPLYMGVSIAALFLVPYTIIKVRSISKEREQKLDELMEEMEEEFDEDDPRRLRRPDPESESEEDDNTAKPLFGNDDTPSPGNELDEDDEIIITEEDLESELDEFELEPSETASDSEETSDPEKSAEPVSSLLAESDFDKDLNEFMAEELDVNEEKKDLASELSLDDSSHDQAIKELQEDGELIELEDNLPASDPFANYSELDEDEQDKAIKDLQDEMERTINQLTQQIEEPDVIPSSMKDLSQIRIGGDDTIDQDYSPDKEEEEFFLDESPVEPPEIPSEAPSFTEEPSEAEKSTTISELSDSEILASLEPELEAETIETENIEADDIKVEPESIPDTRDYEPEVSAESFTFEPESDISPTELNNEPEITSESFTFEPEEAPEYDREPASLSMEPEPIEPEEVPEYDREQVSLSMEPEGDYSPPEKADSLIDRLKFLQTRFENRYQPSTDAPVPIEKKSYPSESLEEPRRYTRAPASVPPDSKKYMDLLESFIFMKDQKKHK
jgi:predicted transcriptional regulator